LSTSGPARPLFTAPGFQSQKYFVDSNLDRLWFAQIDSAKNVKSVKVPKTVTPTIMGKDQGEDGVDLPPIGSVTKKVCCFDTADGRDNDGRDLVKKS
jgi:hypothetical protein